MITTETSSYRILISAITYYDDGSEHLSFYSVSPGEEAACEGVVRSLISRLFETPVDEGGTPGSFVSVPTPITKIECSLEVIEDALIMEFAGPFPDA